MTLRIAEIHRVLKPTGSFYLHCDSSASHYLKLVLDAIFCAKGGDFRNEIIWIRSNPKSHITVNFPTCTDTILRYTKTLKCTFNQPYGEHNQDYVDSAYKYSDENGRYRLLPLLNPNDNRPNLTYEFLGVTRVWRWTKERMQKAYDEGLVVQLKPNAVPQYKKYLEDSKGRTVTNCWTDILQTSGNEVLGYPTQKPEALLERIIKASSNEGDVILDAYCGCGTTVAVAEKLNRHWIGIDITYQSISLILKRLEEHKKAALDNIEINGVPKDIESAIALANKKDDRTRKEFEKWMVLTYSKNRAIINDKKGGDGGIDGIMYISDRNEKGSIENKKVIFQVKSDKTLSPKVIRELLGTITANDAVCGVLLTLYRFDNLIKASKEHGDYINQLIGNAYPKIQVICVDDIFQGARNILPIESLNLHVLKQAEQHTEQDDLFAI